ncbi:molybdenum cofactor guanylyltransferase [Cohnella silvisoli]|uniref:Probable molybdenum cofactor guanylyltransferase n=1 Tax=Cohnella silvisoli TaxID=2873699 RepID=A0ABV1KLN4_9BACL|nr:molybdenum cofactor guanylyltransferase [Cohnella silvisoli]MCD9020692.1 molybdenum cofactor guanylyltransferase [Cohnella silvisoli]
MESSSITGAILVGGSNAGMAGTLKALLPLGGETLIERQIKTMREICKEIIVVTNTPKPFFEVLDPSVRIITDYFPGCGPLGGMHAALYLARNPSVWITACDMPFVSAEAARRLSDSRTEFCHAVIPLVHNRPLPLHGIYDKRCAEAAAELLSAGKKELEAFLGHIRWLGIPADSWAEEEAVGDFAFTIHGQEDYERAKKLLENRMSTGGGLR